MASLRDTQRAFAMALRQDPAGAAHEALAVRPAANVAVYRNNADWQFRNSLALSFPVLRRRVGDDYFRQLAFHYRQRFPSRSGDLHWVGRDFADFLALHLAGGDYAWLADLARLEWAREQAGIAHELPALGVEALAKFPPEDLGSLVFDLQPSLRLGASAYPVLSVWLANQTENASPVGQSAGAEQYLVRIRSNVIEVARMQAALYAFLDALKNQMPMADAMSAADLDESALLSALQYLFGEGLVVGVGRPSAGHAAPSTQVHSAKR